MVFLFSKRKFIIEIKKNCMQKDIKFYLICALIYVTVSYDDDMRNQRTMMRGRPDDMVEKSLE